MVRVNTTRPVVIGLWCTVDGELPEAVAANLGHLILGELQNRLNVPYNKENISISYTLSTYDLDGNAINRLHRSMAQL